jgi:hypothetical protein
MLMTDKQVADMILELDPFQNPESFQENILKENPPIRMVDKNGGNDDKTNRKSSK